MESNQPVLELQVRNQDLIAEKQVQSNIPHQ
jgi:hypothetical protein